MSTSFQLNGPVVLSREYTTPGRRGEADGIYKVEDVTMADFRRFMHWYMWEYRGYSHMPELY